MSTRRSLEYEKWQAACREERQAWAQVTGKLPGSPAHDAGAWRHWQECLQEAAEALQRYSAARKELTEQLERGSPR
jgi:hypothetical protein